MTLSIDLILEGQSAVALEATTRILAQCADNLVSSSTQSENHLQTRFKQFTTWADNACGQLGNFFGPSAAREWVFYEMYWKVKTSRHRTRSRAGTAMEMVDRDLHRRSQELVVFADTTKAETTRWGGRTR